MPLRVVQGIVLGLLGIAGPLGCTSERPPKLLIVARGGTVQAIPQKDAPVQIVSITPTEDNLLASVVVKNATDRYVQDFGITWIIFRPVNCAESGPSPRIQQASTESQSWSDRVFKPHEQIKVKSFWLTPTSLLERAKKYNAKKLHVQVGVGYVNFATGDKFVPRNGLPDWRFQREVGANVLDAEDAARQACG
jgi:hypothetical protein